MQRDARYEAIVQMLLDRDVEDREARERRQLGYAQYLESSGNPASALSPSSPIRLHKFRTNVPCRVTPEAQTLLDDLMEQFAGATVTFVHTNDGRQAILLSSDVGIEPRQIGWVEHSVEPDPLLCNVRNQGLAVETDGDMMLVLRFRYPPTGVRMSSRQKVDDVVRVDFTEIRPALDFPTSEEGSAPPLVWVTRPEFETMDAVGSRDYEAFYLRFKLEVQAGLWNALSGLLSNSLESEWHSGWHYTVVRQPDETNGRIYQTSVDDAGNAVDIGLDRIYDAAAATDILLLYLAGDILADFADIYLTLQSLGPTDGHILKEEFFATVRRFWGSTHSLGWRYSSELAAVVRMSQRAVPTPAQVLLLKQDWTNLRQSMFDRFGEGGRNAADLVGRITPPRATDGAWDFASFPAGDVNLGLRLVYRQEWRLLEPERGAVIRTVPFPPIPMERMHSVETTIHESGATRNLGEIVDTAVEGITQALRLPREVEGNFSIGIRSLGARTHMGVEVECRQSSRETGTRLTDIMLRMASRIRDEAAVVANVESNDRFAATSPANAEASTSEDAATYVFSRLQNRYEVLTRPAEIQNVVLVAEKLPTPAEIDLAWVRQHDWIIANALLDESFRDALTSINQTMRSCDAGVTVVEPDYVERERELNEKRDHLYEHIRSNIFHYQRAIWQQEDPQQRCLRYRKSCRKVPVEWQFELELSEALTIDELCQRLTAPHVAGQFAAYSTGQAVDLDLLIDPAGPIGYYGNYTIYHMRPEFGSQEMFSMLHFFKSPYLCPDPETGEPDVVDPDLLIMSDDPAVVRAADARERARKIAFDTDSVIIDVIRPIEPALENLESCIEPIDLIEASEGYELILNSALGTAVLSVAGHRNSDAGWTILQSEGEAVRGLIAGLGAPHAVTPDSGAEGILARNILKLIPPAGVDTRHATDPIVLPTSDQTPTRLLLAGDAAAHAPGSDAGRLILAASNGQRLPGLLAGALRMRTPMSGHAGGILPRADAERAPALRAGGGVARVYQPAADQVVPVRESDALRPSLVAG